MMKNINSIILTTGLVLLILVMFGCIGGGPQQNNNIVEEKKEVTTITNVSEKPKITLNISEYINMSKINYSKYEENVNYPLNVYFMNAGDDEEQADGRAIIIKKGNFDMLIDSGNNKSYAKIHDLISSISDDIEIFVISSNTKENGNIKKVIEDFGIGEIWYAKKEGIEDALKLAQSKGIKTKKIREGDNFTYNGILFKILNPPLNSTFEDMDNNAIVMKVKDRNITLLLTSNIKDGAMGRIVSDYKGKLKATLLEIPHYGDRVGQSNTRILITEVNPLLTIVEGYKPNDMENGPKSAVLNLLDNIYRGLKSYETWNYNAIIFNYDGKKQGVTFIEK